MLDVENGRAVAIYRVREDVWVGTPTLDHVDLGAAAVASGQGKVHATVLGADVADTVAAAGVVGVALDAAPERSVVQLQERRRVSNGRLEHSRAKPHSRVMVHRQHRRAHRKDEGVMGGRAPRRC